MAQEANVNCARSVGAKREWILRSGAAIKHASLAGPHRHGGVLVVFGDDHPSKSSTVAHQSEPALAVGRRTEA